MAKMKPHFKIAKLDTPADLRNALRKYREEVPVSDSMDALKHEVFLNGRTLPNSIALHPIEGKDANTDGSPSAVTMRRYIEKAEQGAAVIWFEAAAVTEDGRDSGHQLWIRRENIDGFKKLTEAADEACLRKNGFKPYKVIQLTHSGRKSKDINGNPKPLTVVENPYLDTVMGKAEVVTDEFLDNLQMAVIDAAELAREAGFDAVDVKLCHEYLMKETMFAFKRPGRYGGPLENRFRFLLGAIDGIRSKTRGSIDITVRLNAYDSVPYPYGWGMKPEEGVMQDDQAEVDILLDELEKRGVELINLSAASPSCYPENFGYLSSYIDDVEIDPFRGEAHLLKVTYELRQKHPRLRFISTGLASYAQFAPYVGAGGIAEGWFDLAGFGRNALADSQFVPNILKKGEVDGSRLCMRCGNCYKLLESDLPTGCPVRDPFYIIVNNINKRINKRVGK
ncbi:MAG: hypothetical protein ACOYJI_01640 [Anaerovoracaceae bacterium]|jgi:2,4-dienoyl-CoA reductase-like NADH-dependent reductase (Old Yellow Enzyme family)